jgi:Uma2 family endonuclease
MATAPTLLSIEDYLRTSYRPDADYVDGEIEERNLGEFDHARLQYLLAAHFAPREKLWFIQGVVEQRIRVSQRRVRIADFALLRADAPREKVTATPPLLCIEIMSPKDRISRAEVVLADYLAMGVPNIWLIDPIKRAAFTFDATGLHDADPTRLTVPNTPIHLDLTEAFAALA